MGFNDIGQTRFQRRLTHELKIKGDQPSPVLAPEIQPVLVVEAERPELLHLQGEWRYSHGATNAAVGGEYWYWMLQNPAGSNTLIIVEEVQWCDITATSTLHCGVGVVAYLASLAGVVAACLDTRVPQNVLGRPCIGAPFMGTDPGAIGLATQAVVRATQNVMVGWKPLNYVLPPGYIFALRIEAVAQAMCGYVIWRERAAEVAELA